VLETYRAAFKNARINEELRKDRLTLPVLTVGAPEFFGPLVKEQMLKVANRVDRAEIFEECGHSLALEADHRLASLLREFMLSR
jgi:pimeloyl-ACP methyl ester carboxylesterase